MSFFAKITADQGAAGATAWPVTISGGVTVGSITAVTAFQAGAWNITAATAYQGTSPWLVQQGAAGATAWPVSVSGTPNVFVTNASAVTATAFQGGSWTVTNALGTAVMGDIGNITASITPGTGVANLGKQGSTAFASAAPFDTGVLIYGVRRDDGARIAATANNSFAFPLLDGASHWWIAGGYRDGNTGTYAGNGAAQAVSGSVLAMGAAYYDNLAAAVASSIGYLRMTVNRELYVAQPTAATWAVSGSVTAAQSGTWSIASATAYQGTSPWVVQQGAAGATAWPVSVSGTGNVFVTNASAVTATVTGTANVFMTNSSAVTAFQGTSPWLVQQGAAGATAWPTTVSGTANVFVTNASAVTATVASIAAVTAFQGTNPWAVQQGAAGATAWPMSVSGTANVFVTNASAVTATVASIAAVTAFQGTSPWLVQQGAAGATAWPVSVSGDRSATATVTSVAGSLTSVTLLASNANRKQAMIYNDTIAGDSLYVKLGTTASTTAFTVRLVNNGYYELPSPVYTGRIDGIWISAGGSARITELT